MKPPVPRWRLSACLTALVSLATGLISHGQQPAGLPEFFPGQVLVQFRPGAAGADFAEARNVVGAITGQAVRLDGSLELLTTGLEVADAVKALQALPQVEFAQPNWIYRHFDTSNDTYYTNGTLWGMYGDGTSPANQYGSQAGEVWAQGRTGSSNVYVGVIDEGIDFNHPDLVDNIWTNPFDPVDGVDNDGNGKVDDIHGWDFFENNNSVYDGSPSNLNLDAHGTHVSGTIGGKGGNGTGVAGVNWNVRIISGKFLGPSGGSSAAAASALDYFTDLKTRHNLNIVATSNSWGGGTYDLALHQAIIRSAKQGILFIAAAGNGGLDGIGDNNDTVTNYPSNYATDVAAGSETAASYDAVIAVASITSTGGISSFSNYGATTVDIGAPGSAIMSTTPQTGYSSYSGTSMATPHVSGAAALYKSINTGASALEIRNAILNNAVATPSLAGKTVTGGRLNVGEFAPITTSLAIDNVSVTEGNSGTQNATFTVSLSEASLATVTVNYATAEGTATVGANAITTVSNTAAITIPSSGAASPYPSNVTAPSGLGSLTNVKVTLTGFSHTYTSDVDIMLVGPGGQSVVLLSDVAGESASSNLTLAIDDSGVAAPTTALASTTYRPTNLGTADTWTSPAPSAPSGTTLSAFNGLDPAGVWKLYVVDDASLDVGSISGGWSLTLTTPGLTGDYLSTSGTLSFSPGQTSSTFNVVVNGDTAVEANESFAVNLSGASSALIGDSLGYGTILNDDRPPFTDATLTAGTSVIKAVHVTELRTRINDVRAARGLAAYAFTDSTLTAGVTVIQAVHVLELRTALAEAYAAAGLTQPTYSTPIPAPGVTAMRIAITELRSWLLSIE